MSVGNVKNGDIDSAVSYKIQVKYHSEYRTLVTSKKNYFIDRTLRCSNSSFLRHIYEYDFWIPVKDLVIIELKVFYII